MAIHFKVPLRIWSRKFRVGRTIYLILLFLTCLQAHASVQLVDVTIQRNSRAITYESDRDGDWRESWPGVRRAEGYSARASFEFVGTAIWYQGWLWSQPTSFLAQVDDKVFIVDVTNRAALGPPGVHAAPSKKVVMLIVGNLTEAVHTVVLRKDEAQREVIVGSFIYSTSNPPPPPTTSSLTQYGTPRPTSGSTTPSPNSNLNIIIRAVAGSFAALLLLLIALFVCLWKRCQRRAQCDSLTDPDSMMVSGYQRVSITNAKRGVRDDDEEDEDRHVIHFTSVPAHRIREWSIE